MTAQVWSDWSSSGNRTTLHSDLQVLRLDKDRGFSFSRIGSSALLLIGLFLLPSCTGQVANGGESLEGAVERFWTYRLEKDYGSIYEKSIDRESRQKWNDKASFVGSKGNVQYHRYEIEEVTVDGITGKSRVRYFWNHTRQDFADRPPFEETLEDEWILEDGSWRRKFKPLSLPGSKPSEEDPK